MTFTPAGEVGALTLWQLYQERSAESRISSKGENITFAEHMDFVRHHPYRMWFVISTDGHNVGSIYAGHDNTIGIAILKKHQGQGYASAAIDRLTAQNQPLPELPSVRPGHWVANMSPQNRASAALFKKLGFELVQHTYAKR